MQRILIVLVATLIVVSCQKPQQTGDHQHAEDDHEHTDGHEHEGDEKSTDEYQYFGEVIDEQGAIGMGEMLSLLDGADSVLTKVVGTVESVCQVKGCWMNVFDAKDAEATTVFVKFKDYGFFVPKDISGRRVVMKGKAFREVTSVDELRHYAEDEGKTAEEIAQITEPTEELKFLASGVKLLED